MSGEDDNVDPPFDGNTYSPHLDGERLGKQLDRVRHLMEDHQWRTLDEISFLVGAPSQSVSARLRDLRKKKFGGLEVQTRRRGDPSLGVWESRVLEPIELPSEPKTLRLTPKQAMIWLEALLLLMEEAEDAGVEVSTTLEDLAQFLAHRARLNNNERDES